MESNECDSSQGSIRSEQEMIRGKGREQKSEGGCTRCLSRAHKTGICLDTETEPHSPTQRRDR
jgi:hypothetical protein